MAMMNENKGVFGLNMLHWWDREGEPRPGDRAAHRRTSQTGTLEPVVAESFPFDRAGDAHRFIARAPQRRQGRARAMTAVCRRPTVIEIASLGSFFDEHIVDAGKLPAFLFLVFFLGTFGFIRTSAHMIRAQVKWWPGNVRSAAPTSITWSGGSCC